MLSRSPLTRRERTTLIGVVVLFSTVSFTETAIIAVLPTAARQLHGIGSFGWLFTGFIVAKIVGLVLAGQYSDSHGPRVVLMTGLVLFAGAVLVAGSAPTMAVLVAGRMLQGLGGGMILTSVYVVIGQIFPDEVMPKVQSAIGTAFVLPVLAGPLIAGTVAQEVSWRLAFLGLGPVVLVAIALILPILRAARGGRERAVRRNSLPNAVAAAVAMAVMETVGQNPPPWRTLGVVAVPAVVVLVWGLRGIVPPGTFRVRHGVAAPIALRTLYGGAFFGGCSLVPLVMTLQHGHGASTAALPLVVSDVSYAVGSWWQGRPPRGDEGEHRVRLVRVGFVLTMPGLLATAAVAHPSVPSWVIYPAWCVTGLGAGMTFATFNVLVLRHTTDTDRGFDSAASQLSGSVGQAITTGVAGVLIAAAADGAIRFDTAFTWAYAMMAALLVAGVAAAGRLRAPVRTPAQVFA
jgi:MFS family permease